MRPACQSLTGCMTMSPSTRSLRQGRVLLHRLPEQILYGQFAITPATDFFEGALERGECCVCFDGLDELGAAGLRREITQAVSAMANRYPRNRFIVTSRIVGYDKAPLDRADLFHHTVQPLGDDDIKLFVEKWYKAREHDAVIRRERTEHLVKTIMSEERIKSLASNPLMLTIIALVHRIEAELPHERVKLYDKCVTALVETWDRTRGIKTTLRRRLLEKLAYSMRRQPGDKGRAREVREGNLRLQLTQFLGADPNCNWMRNKSSRKWKISSRWSKPVAGCAWNTVKMSIPFHT